MHYIKKIEQQIDILEKLIKTADPEKYKAIALDYDNTWGMLEDFMEGLNLALMKLESNSLEPDKEKLMQLTRKQFDIVRNALLSIKDQIEELDQEIYNLSGY